MKFDATYDNITDTFHITLASEGMRFISTERTLRVIVETGIDIVGLKIPNFRHQAFGIPPDNKPSQ